MTEYDPPAIDNPENVDALTHQQIVDAFDTVRSTGVCEVLAHWGRAQELLRQSTAELIQAVRTATDGRWTGAGADAAAAAVTHYGDRAEVLADLFSETASTVADTALTAVLTKSFLPPVVPITADPKSEPIAYARQHRAATDAEHEARRIMRERYIVGFTHQDSKLPTFPQAVTPTSAGE